MKIGKKITAIAFAGLMHSIYVQAMLSPGFSFSYGYGKPDHLIAYRLSWQIPWFEHAVHYGNLLSYWNFSFNYCTVSPPARQQVKQFGIIAAAPIFYWQARAIQSMQPHLAFSIGPALLSRSRLGHRNLGGRFAFQDLIGVGCLFSKRISLDYYYIHYSNAHLFPPNQGIDVKQLVSFGYYF